jgi:hypothetical protein
MKDNKLKEELDNIDYRIKILAFSGIAMIFAIVIQNARITSLVRQVTNLSMELDKAKKKALHSEMPVVLLLRSDTPSNAEVGASQAAASTPTSAAT